MSKLLLLIVTCTSLTDLFSQSIKKYPIGDSGCSAYFFCTPSAFNVSYSDDSSKVYTGDCVATDSLTYGLICIKLKEKVADIQQAEDLTLSYLDYLKKSFDISSAAGYGKGHRLEGKENTRGIIDYWKDKTGNDWKIKAWTDGKFIGVLYVYAKGSLTETNRVNLFLDGFRWPVVE
jgi:hypothetical protein